MCPQTFLGKPGAAGLGGNEIKAKQFQQLIATQEISGQLKKL
jgi:hypothetical protein